MRRCVAKRLFRGILAFIIGGPLGWLTAADRTWSAETDQISFNEDIRPILSENCFHCHGPDSENRQAGLRLDIQEAAHEYAVVPGDADASDVVFRIESDDADLRMPPPDSERQLTPRQIQLVRQWIEQGGEYQRHWSFGAPRSPTVPNGNFATSIDAFIESALDRQRLPKSPPADRHRLLRRAAFDLTGLPPRADHLDRFLNDDSPDAFSAALDRLLADPRYGERMASDWLDIARYSDTYGYQVDRDRFVWPWRDWVVSAFNDNMPYDQFITEQLAGDLIPGATRDQILATTFNRLHPQKVEGGSVPEEFRVEYVSDRAQTVATGIMGLTYECCRCHHHKYDPISQQEYFQLSAFFDNIDEAGLYSYFTESVPTPTLALPSDDQQRRLNSLQSEIQRLEPSDQAVGQHSVEPVLSESFEGEIEPPNQSVAGVTGQAIRLTGDDAFETTVGNFRRSDPFSISLWIKLPDSPGESFLQRSVVLHRSRAWTDAASRGYELLIDQGKLRWSLIHFWPGNAISIRTEADVPLGAWVHVVVTNDGSSSASGLSLFVNGEKAETEVVRDQLTRQITGGGGDTIALGQRFRDRGFTGGAIDELAVYEGVLTADSVRSLHTRPQIRLGAVSNSPGSRLTELRRRRDELLDKVDEIMVMRELPQPRPTYVLARGMYDQPTEPVTAGTPDVLPAFPQNLPDNRLGLAKWLTSPNHPLTARVAVNRLWQICFGVGLVRTPEDFGSQGQPPTHPELLDHLAIELVRGGWDMKSMLKTIMMSDTYRRDSRPVNDDVVTRDPTNRYYARFPAYRLTAEMLRDQALAVSGRLVNRIGGAPVKPYEIEFSFKPDEVDRGAKLYRRSLYTYWKRTGPAPEMLTLDAAKRDVCRARRERTSSPLQALVLLNGPQYVEAARGLAENLLADKHRDGKSVEDRALLNRVMRALVSRDASEQEMAVLSDLWEQQLAAFADDPDSAQTFLAVGRAPVRDDLDPIRLAALTAVVNTLMNFDPCVMKR